MKILNFPIKKNQALLIVILVFLGSCFYLNSKSNNELNINSKIDFIKVDKSERKLFVYSNGKLVKVYNIALGKKPNGAKQYQGDNKTPEGVYLINAKNSNSIAYKNLGISYPNNKDIDRAKKLGKSTGGDIKIHGMMNGLGFIGRFHTCFDWTNGCIAVTNSEIDELFKYIKIGTKIEILP
jgi:murein L,D-transpeptidase YafK